MGISKLVTYCRSLCALCTSIINTMSIFAHKLHKLLGSYLLRFDTQVCHSRLVAFYCIHRFHDYQEISKC